MLLNAVIIFPLIWGHGEAEGIKMENADDTGEIGQAIVETGFKPVSISKKCSRKIETG